MMFSFWPWLFVFLAVSWDVDAAGTFTSSAKIELRANRADTLPDVSKAFSSTLNTLIRFDIRTWAQLDFWYHRWGPVEDVR